MSIEALRSDTETTRAVVKQAYERGDAKDFEGFAALLADEVIVEEADGHPVPGTFRGKHEVVPALGQILGTIGMTRIDVLDLVVEGPLAIALIDIACTGKDGESFIMPAAESWWVHDGKVVKIRPYYFDTATLAARVQGTPAPAAKQGS